MTSHTTQFSCSIQAKPTATITGGVIPVIHTHTHTLILGLLKKYSPSYFIIMLIHNIISRCLWYGRIGWTLLTHLFFTFFFAFWYLSVEQYSGKMASDKKMHTKQESRNSSKQKKKTTFIDCRLMLMETKLWKYNHS